MEENLGSKLIDFSKLSFQSELEVVARGKPMLELKDLLQTNTKESVISERAVPTTVFKKKVVGP